MNYLNPAAKLRTLALLVLLVVCNNVFAQVQTARYISMGPSTKGYYEYLPEGYESGNENYPLLIFIHGVGEVGDGSPTQLRKLLVTGVAASINVGELPKSFTVNGQTHRLIVISPQFNRGPSPTDINGVIDYVISHYRVNTSRIYLTGLSMGGGAVWDYAGSSDVNANRLAAIVPIAGASWPDYNRSRRIANADLPVWALHNNADPTVPVSYTNNYVAQINEAPAPTPMARKTIFTSSRHDAWTNVYNSKYRENGLSAYEWMLQYQKGTPPPPSTNIAPTVTASADQTITLPANSVQVNAVGSDVDGTISYYSWRKLSGPTQFTISNPDIPNPTISNLAPGVYTFRVSVSDNKGGSGYDDVVINVIAGIPGKIQSENYSAMSGVQLENTNDAGAGQNVGYIDLNDWMDYKVNVTAAGSYAVNLRVATSSGGKFDIRKGDGTVLGTVTVPVTGGFQAWQTISKVISLDAGAQTLRIISTSTARWNINWMEFVSSTATPNTAPVVNAGTDASITLPTNSVQLAGSATDADGSIASYAWTKVSGGAATFSSTAAANPTISGLAEGTYTFRLTATDNSGTTASDDVVVTVNPSTTTTPVGPSTRIQAESWSAMFGVKTETTRDVDGGLNVGWQENGDWIDYAISPASAGSYKLNFRVATVNTGVQVQVRNAAGSVLATLTVNNTGGWQTYQTLAANVTLPAGAQTLRIFTQDAKVSGWNFNWLELVSNATSQAPVVNAGTDQAITLPTNSLQLAGNATDADGTIATYAWTKVSGGAATFSSTTVANPTISGLTSGTYTFRLTATDNSGATASDDVVVTVNPDPSSTTTPGSTPVRIQAENWSTMYGVKTETTRDVDGGLNVGWQENGDWMDYSVTLAEAGTYTVKFRVATVNTGVQVQLRDAAGTVLSTVTVNNTGGWQTYQTISTQVTLPAGQQILRVFTLDAKSTGWNVNWLEFALTSAATVQAKGTDAEVEASTTGTTGIYPNPVQDRFVLQVSNEYTGAMTAAVYDLSGALVKTFRLQKGTKGASQSYLSAAGLKAGEYFIKVSMAGWSQTVKMNKQ